ncbi:MAG: YggT family protein [Rhodobacteraceae bacterium]|nr:YggT family protein [Paracoccaceae bacterium]
MPVVYDVLNAAISVAWWIVIIHIVMSWLINFQVLNTRQQLVAQIWYGLNRLLEPIYRPIRNVLPNTGGIDLSPIIVFLGLIALQSFNDAYIRPF